MREQPWARAVVPCSLGLQNLLFKLESLSLSPTHFLTRPPPLPAGISASSLGPRQMERRSLCSHKTKGFLWAPPWLGRAGPRPPPASLS